MIEVHADIHDGNIEMAQIDMPGVIGGFGSGQRPRTSGGDVHFITTVGHVVLAIGGHAVEAGIAADVPQTRWRHFLRRFPGANARVQFQKLLRLNDPLLECLQAVLNPDIAPGRMGDTVGTGAVGDLVVLPVGPLASVTH